VPVVWSVSGNLQQPKGNLVIYDQPVGTIVIYNELLRDLAIYNKPLRSTLRHNPLRGNLVIYNS
jgi:hypothetical protein